MNTYSVGFPQTAQALGVAILLMCAFSLAVISKARGFTNIGKVAGIAFISLTIVPACFAVLLFPAIFSTFNLFRHDIFTVSFWTEEFANGIFALRVSSYVLTVQLIISFNRLVRTHSALTKVRVARGLDIDKATDHTIEHQEPERTLRIGSDVNFQSVFQFVFYLCCVAILWLSVILGIHTAFISTANWCLFFVVDDWAIISDYTHKYSVPAILSHHYKILAFNAALFILIGIVAITRFDWYISAIVVSALLFCLLGIYMYSWRSRKFSSLDPT